LIDLFHRYISIEMSSLRTTETLCNVRMNGHAITNCI